MGKHRHSSARPDRRGQFTEPTHPKASRGTLPIVLGGGLLFLGLIVLIVGRSTGNAPVASITDAAPAGADVVLAASVFDDGQAKFYRYATASGREVRFFVMKSADGVVRAAFDACDVCYRERKGYRQSGDSMICVNCGKAFPSTQINVLQGGCNPAPIERTISGGQVVLAAASLERGAAYF